MYLFDESAFEGCAKPDDAEKTVTIARGRKRWDPIAAGFVTLAKVHVGPRQEGRGDYGTAWHQVTFEVVGKKGQKGVGRRMFERFMVAGTTTKLQSLVLDAKSQVKSALLCHSPEKPASLDPTAIDGMIVPIVTTVYERYGSKKIVNGARIVCAHPQSRTYGDYLALVERVGPETYVVEGGEVLDRVPGWRLYPDAPAAAIMARMMARQADVEDANDFDLEIVATTEAARRAQLARMIPKVRDALATAEGKIQGKRDRAAAASATAANGTTPEKAASRSEKADRASQVLRKAEARLDALRARLAGLLAEWKAIEEGGWKPAARKTKEVAPLVLTHAQIMAEIAKPLPDFEKARRAAVRAESEASEAEFRARPAPTPEEERAHAVRRAQARLDQTPARAPMSVWDMAAAKRRREARELDEEIRRARIAKLGKETVITVAPRQTREEIDAGSTAHLPKDHPDYCPF